jgi:single-strand DNA-binding protein
MANLNKVMLIGRLTRDPEPITFEGGKGVKFGFAVNNRKKNTQSGEWEDVPVWIDCKAFDRPEGRKMATLLLDTVKKGQQIFIEGRLTFEEWKEQDTGAKRTALRVIVEDFQYLTPKEGGGMGGGMDEGAPRAAARPASRPAAQTQQRGGSNKPLYREGPPDEDEGHGGRDGGNGGSDEEIPF